MEIHPKNPVAVLGIGNLLMKDDGIGIHALKRLQADPPSGVDLYDVGTSILRTQNMLEEYPIVVILDAIVSGASAGTVICIEGQSLEGSQSNSLHDMGVAEVLSMIPQEKRPRLIVLGIEPSEVEIGLELSEPAARALPQLEKSVREMLSELLNENVKKTTNVMIEE